MRYSTLLVVALSAVLARAQTPAQLAAQIPACALPCDTAGIKAANCSLTDYACHCAHSTFLAATIVPCLQKNSTCTTSDLQTFGGLVEEICEHLNVTSSPTTTGTASPVKPTSSSSVVPFPGAASHIEASAGLLAVIGLAAAIVL